MIVDKEQILKYLNNELSLEDRHMFEKQMLVDPFLNDAVEGLSEISSDTERREILNAFYTSFEVETVQKSNFKLWLGSAAAIILLVVVSVFVINRLNEQASSTSLSEKSTPEKEQLDKILTEIDSTENESDTTPDSSDESIVENQEILSVAEEVSTEDNEEILAESVNEEISAEQSIVEEPENEIDEVTDEGIALADVTEEQLPEEEAVTDDILEEKEKEEEFLIAQDVSQPITEQESKKARRTENQGSVQEEAPIAARSMAVEVAQSSTPEGGFESYLQYIQENLVYPQTAIDANISGTVTIQFNVDTSGRPANLQVINGIGYGCDEEALRLIQEGANWSRTPDVVNYSIEFIRK